MDDRRLNRVIREHTADKTTTRQQGAASNAAGKPTAQKQAAVGNVPKVYQCYNCYEWGHKSDVCPLTAGTSKNPPLQTAIADQATDTSPYGKAGGAPLNDKVKGKGDQKGKNKKGAGKGKKA